MSNQKLQHYKQSFVAQIIRKISPRIGARALIEPEYGFVGMVQFKNGKRILFRDRNFNINPQGSSEIARDKAYATFFLKYFQYSVPEGKTFFSKKMNAGVKIKRTIDDGYRYAQHIGFPVIVKPNNLSQGTLVTKVHNKTEYYSIARKIFKKVGVMIVERFYSGNDYRIVVLDNEVISAYQRIPLFVIGDGKLSIGALLAKKQKKFNKIDRDTVIDLTDYRIRMKLKHEGYTLNSILSAGIKLFLLDNANLSTGGEAVDVTEKLHSDFRKLAVRVTKDMGLRMCGVDIITSGDINKPLTNYTIIEINSAPGLDNYASIGRKQKEKVYELYLKVLKALEIM
jgi:D-alanine-D-alanine ligase-like ATP-grasp enzyme